MTYNININFSTKIIYKIYTWITLGFFIVILSACVSTINSDDHYCFINKNDNFLKYSSYFNTYLSPLKKPKNFNIVLPTPSMDYDIPLVDSIIIDDQKKNINLNICPPVILKDIFNESCLINTD